MKFHPVLLMLILVLCQLNLPGQSRNVESENQITKHKNVGITEVKWTEGFWADRVKLIREEGIHNMWKILSEESLLHSKQNFLIAAGLMEGEHVGTNWIDGDTYKWLESVARVYATTGDRELDGLMDEVIEIIGKAQQQDGYINTHMTIAGKEHFQNVQDHETYNLGHLMTAASVHFQVTGKTNFLEIAKRAADCLHGTFMGTEKHFLGYSSIMGLVDLYRVTGEEHYRDLANHFVNIQGSGNVEARKTTDWTSMGGAGRQDHMPVRETSEAVGHAVRGNYLYCGATDVYSETGDTTLLGALENIWESVAYRKMYITGGVSALYRGATLSREVVWEAYGHDYQLNNATAYNETCANIGFGMWSWRLLQATGNARYADVMERVMYNSALSPISLDAKHFFYTNPLQRVEGVPIAHRHDTERWTHHSGFCCPPNVMRTIPKISTWAYSLTSTGIAVNLYGGNKLNSRLADGSELMLTQQSDYPWDGLVSITIEAAKQEAFEIKLRIPEWAEGSKITINGQDSGVETKPGTYATIERKWKKGDQIALHMPMEIQQVEGNPLIEEVRNQVALQRGPIVYCLEDTDLPANTKILDAYLPANSMLKATHKPNLLNGVTVIEAEVLIRKGRSVDETYSKLERPKFEKINSSFIPYYAWANRGSGEMTVWLPVVWESN